MTNKREKVLKRMNLQCSWRVGRWCVFFLFLLFPGFPGISEAETIAQLVGNPKSFDQQAVTVAGESANVVTRYGEAPYTTMDLVDGEGTSLAVLVSKIPDCKQGEICRVSGLFVAEKMMILPEKVEKVAAAEQDKGGILFRKRKGWLPSGLNGKVFRDVYIPQ
ncbi:MAG: hypothetical protein HYZ50_26900 [Deltaproteobacteria bacterium]|nr:hypothetical protein [Deltaproteobacteria bacterium]